MADDRSDTSDPDRSRASWARAKRPPGVSSAGRRLRSGKDTRPIPPPPHRRDDIVIERIVDDQAVPRSRRRSSRREIDVSDVAFDGLPPATGEKLRRRLAEAAVAFEAERFTDADRLLASIGRLAPSVAEVHELRGLVFYRLGRWARASTELQHFATMTGSVEQHPVWADCCRALGRWREAEELWRELGDASPTPELVEEGRIVQAGGLADRGRIADAIRLLEKAPKPTRAPAVHHLRRWYVLADLYERSGDLARARRLFSEVRSAEPEFADVIERLAALS